MNRNLRRGLKTVLAALCSRTYRFRLDDYWLYLRYGRRPGHLRDYPNILVREYNAGFVHLVVQGQCYVWPRDRTIASLDHVFREVNAPASQNAHAYEFAGVRIRWGDCVVDAGASEGFFTRYALQRGASVMAFEPIPVLAECLSQTFVSEIANHNVKVYVAALEATSGRRNFSISDERLCASRFAPDGIAVPTVALDDILGDTRVDFIKMDIEGAEPDALRGAARVIARDKPRLAIAAYHNLDDARQIMGILTRIRPDYVLRHRGIWATDDGCEPRPMMVYAW